MIYTIGNRRSYIAALGPDGVVYKTGKCDLPERPNYPGGYAFRTVEEAERRIEEAYPEKGFAVFGLKADWEVDTYPSPDGWWHSLLVDAEIVFLDLE